VTVEGVDSETEDATFTTISDPLYKKCEDFEPGFKEDNGYAEKGFFTISGPTEDCDDVGLAFDADGLVMGSIDFDCSVFLGDMNPDDIDDKMMTTERPVQAMSVVIR